MKKIATLVFLLHTLTVFSQFNDNFSDGLFTSSSNSPRSVEWSGDAGDFIVNQSFQLQLFANGSHTSSQLRTASSTLSNTTWEFYVKMDFTPTTSNYAKIYLASDEENLSGELNGFFVRVGYTDKNITLMSSQKGKTNQTLIQGSKQRLTSSSSNEVKIKVTLDESGNFKLYSQLTEESDFLLEGNSTVSDLPVCRWFGVVCVYTTTRSKQFYFDDFLVTAHGTTPDPNLNGELPNANEILFSEIMANPATGNPEYVELYNRTDKTFQLKNCLFFYGDKSYKLPEKVIEPYSYFVLTKTTAIDWFANDVVVCGVASLPALANTGKLLMFENALGEPVSWFEYSDKMYGDNVKKGGGWSLECIDLSNLSNTAANWSASNEVGGTPGKENSLSASNPDVVHPEILSYSQSENHVINVTFSKSMNRKNLLDKNNYKINMPAYSIVDLQANYPQGNELRIQLNDFPPRGNFLEIEVNNMVDLSANTLSETTLIIGEAYEAEYNDLIINELLFNPPVGGNEYVEIYNCSDKVIDLRSLSITSRKPSDGSLNKLYPLSAIPLFLHPKEYLVITKSQESVCAFFKCLPESFFVQLAVMPSIANTSGCVVLLNNHTDVILDEFSYNDKMHSKGITNKKGVALERISFNKPTGDESNWTSATAQSGYGTPGYENSQHLQSGLGELKAQVKIFIEYPLSMYDEYWIQYQLDKPGYKCKIMVYDSSGRRLENLLNNELLGLSGKIAWNGKTQSAQKLNSGIYILYIELYDTVGKVQHFKLPVVVK